MLQSILVELLQSILVALKQSILVGGIAATATELAGDTATEQVAGSATEHATQHLLTFVLATHSLARKFCDRHAKHVVQHKKRATCICIML